MGENSDKLNKPTPRIPFYPNPWPSPPTSLEECFSLWQDFLHLYNSVFAPQSPITTSSKSPFSRENSRPSSPIRIICDDYSHTTSNNPHDHTATPHDDNTNLEKSDYSNSSTKDENSCSDTDVSVTVSIPSRRKSTSIEYHEEVTVPIPPTITEDIQGNNNRECDESKVINHHTRTDSGGSVDFWKEIADDEEDLYFRSFRSRRGGVGPDLSDTTEVNSSEKEMTSRTNSSSGSSSYNVYEFSTNNVPTLVHNGSKVEKEASIGEKCYTSNVSDVDDDSGMNSDTEKYDVSETEAEAEGQKSNAKLPRTSEFKKLSVYERANTHSRLYKLLMKTVDEVEESCGKDSSDGNVDKEYLTLPVNGSTSSSSGINSPVSPVPRGVNEKLIGELVQDLLRWKKDLNINQLSSEKLREVAVRSLQPECRSASPQLTKPVARSLFGRRHIQRGGSVDYSSDNSSSYSSLYYPGFDILPSRAFKNLQSGHTSPVNWPKCPLVPSRSVETSSPNFPGKVDKSES